jgi:hypothetical protein
VIALLRRIEARREALVSRSGQQRAQVAARLAPGVRLLAAGDRLAATVRSHPILAVLVAAGAALVGARSPWRWLLRAVPLYALLRRW